METILKEYKCSKTNPNSGCYEEISLITFLASITEDEITTNEIEVASKILYCAFNNLCADYCTSLENILKERKRYIILVEHPSGSNYKIFIRNVWLFRVILIHSIKHSPILNRSLSDSDVQFFKFIIEHIINDIVIVKPLSLHLLRTLLLIVNKCKDTLSTSLYKVILGHMNKVALSPMTVFRQYARSISKTVTSYIEETIISDVSLLPVRGLDMCDVVKHFPEAYINRNRRDIIEKVLNMFQRNVESKKGGALYECLLYCSFEEWKLNIWPPFFECIKRIDYEGEFFQSLLKYWITATIGTYKTEFYNFLRKEPLDWRIKGYVLLELKKRGYIVNDDIMEKDILYVFVETRNLSLKIASMYHKKSSWPKNFEIDIVMNYLYSNTNLTLEEEETKCFRLFFSQIFLFAHVELKKSEERLSNYMSVLEKIYRYCCANLKTCFFDVGAEFVFTLWTVAAGCHKDLLLNYKLEKKDYYAHGGNLLYKILNNNDMWSFGSRTFQQELIKCFISNNGSSTYLTKLFTKYLETSLVLNELNLKYLLNESLQHQKLDSEKKIKNYSQIIFRNHYCTEDTLEFLKEINDYLINLNVRQESFSLEEIFKAVLCLEIIMVAIKYHKYEAQELYRISENSLSVVESIIKNNTFNGVSYKSTKILEAYINNIMLCIVENKDILWKTIDKEKVIKQLITVIQRSNMKRPLSLSVEVLKHFGYKMDENDIDENYKIRLLNETLMSLYQTQTKSDLKIRRNPESRLVIHALCSSDQNLNKPLIKWVLTFLLEVISDPNAEDSTIASALHSIEILISDNNLQNPTLPFLPEIIIQCVELFSKSSWIVRNADLQLTRAIIDRFYGVCLDVCDRPKCVEDLLVLFPILSPYFYKILSSDRLNEKAVLVFQFFSESQIKEHIYTTEELEFSNSDFLPLFMDILQKYPNHYGKMAVRSYSALCIAKEIPKQICSIIYFFKNNFRYLNKNVYANFIFLIQQLYDKYKKSFEYSIDKKCIRVIHFAIKDLLEYLRNYDTQVCNFILFKVQPLTNIINDFANNLDKESFTNRLWLHNNIPFILINAKPKQLSGILRSVLLKELLYCLQIKILTILVFRFENEDFDTDMLNGILQILFEKAVCINDQDNYLLNCYFKTILAFYQSGTTFRNELISTFTCTSNIYKLLIVILYFFAQLNESSELEKQHVYVSIETMCLSFMSGNEELKNDIIATLAHFENGISGELKLKIFKLIFYASLFTSTYQESFKCICFISKKRYSNIFIALKNFFSVENLSAHLKDKKLVTRFFEDLIEYIPKHVQKAESDGYYSEESDILVPKVFLEKLIYNEIRHM